MLRQVTAVGIRMRSAIASRWPRRSPLRADPYEPAVLLEEVEELVVDTRVQTELRPERVANELVGGKVAPTMMLDDRLELLDARERLDLGVLHVLS